MGEKPGGRGATRHGERAATPAGRRPRVEAARNGHVGCAGGRSGSRAGRPHVGQACDRAPLAAAWRATWERGTLEQASGFFNEALSFSTAQLRGPSQCGDGRRRAQVLKGIGDVAGARGQVASALGHYTEAVKTWDGIAVDNRPDHFDARNAHLLSAVEARLALGFIRDRTGDAAGAEGEYTAAGMQALGVLSAAYERGAVEPTDQFELGRAMQVYADAAISLAVVWWFADWCSGAGVIRMRPLSAQARVQLGTASAILAMASLEGPAPETAAPLFEESGTHFRELTQLDPQNLRMRRESAAVPVIDLARHRPLRRPKCVPSASARGRTRIFGSGDDRNVPHTRQFRHNQHLAAGRCCLGPRNTGEPHAGEAR